MLPTYHRGEFNRRPRTIAHTSLIYRDEPDSPQPRKDRDADKAMAVTVDRLRSCIVFDIRFVGLHHNTCARPAARFSRPS